MTEQVPRNPGVEGSAADAPAETPGPDPALVSAVEARLAQCEGPDWTRHETALLILATVRAYDAEQRNRQRLSGPVMNLVIDPPRPVVVTEVYERRCDGTVRRIR